jgi:hypothetical protein
VACVSEAAAGQSSPHTIESALLRHGWKGAESSIGHDVKSSFRNEGVGVFAEARQSWPRCSQDSRNERNSSKRTDLPAAQVLHVQEATCSTPPRLAARRECTMARCLRRTELRVESACFDSRYSHDLLKSLRQGLITYYCVIRHARCRISLRLTGVYLCTTSLSEGREGHAQTGRHSIDRSS